MTPSRKSGEILPSLSTRFSELFDIDRFFESAIGDGRRYAKIPAANIKETNEEFVIELAAPGMKKRDFHVDVKNNVLEIKVEKEEEAEERRTEFTRREYNYNAFYRSFDLPEYVDTDKIMAEYENGLLAIHIPKLEEARRKRPMKEIAVV